MVGLSKLRSSLDVAATAPDEPVAEELSTPPPSALDMPHPYDDLEFDDDTSAESAPVTTLPCRPGGFSIQTLGHLLRLA